MKIIAVIPARYAASRFPGKLLQPLRGKTVIWRTYEAVAKAGLFHDVFVATDSSLIYEEVTRQGGKAVMSRKEHACGSDRIAEAVEDKEVDVVVNVQGDEPFTERSSLRELIRVFEGEDAARIDVASLMTRIADPQEIRDPNTVKVVVDREGFALYFSRAPVPYVREAGETATCYKHKGVYAFRKRALLEFYRSPATPLEIAEKIDCLRYLENGKKIKMVETAVTGIEIDTPEDLERAEKYGMF